MRRYGNRCKGVDMTKFPALGNAYLTKHFPLLDYVEDVSVAVVHDCPPVQALKDGCLKPLPPLQQQCQWQ